MRFVQIGLVNTGKVAIDLSSVRVKHAVDLIMTYCPSGICICNFWGCNCDGCGTHGQCGCEKCTTDLCTNNCNNDVNNDVRFLTEEKDTCTDYEFFISLSLEEKTKFLGDKYCDDGIAADDIYKKMLTYVDNNLDPNSINLDELELSCDDFNKSTYYREDADVSAIGRKLKLCKNNGNKKGHQKFNKYRKNKKKKNKNSKSE